MNLQRVFRRAVGASLLAGVASASSAACSDRFAACKELRNCAAPVGEGGAAGEATSGGVDGGGVVDGGGNAEGGAGDRVQPPMLGDPCDEVGALRCAGSAQKLSLLCKGGAWIDREVCQLDENCEQQTGVCAPIVPDCENKGSRQRYCAEDDTLFECDQDLVSTAQVEVCTGTCVESGDSAECAPIHCGDGEVQDSEECDDENVVTGDGCSATCTVEPVQLAALSIATCALGSNGRIQCFYVGKDDWIIESVGVEDDYEATSIAGGGSHFCALLKGGNVRCWGNNSSGQLGLGDTEPRDLASRSENVDLGAGAVAVGVAAGGVHSCAVLADGDVKCWGGNQQGQLGFVKSASNPSIGDAAGEMGDALVAVPRFQERAAASIASRGTLTCMMRKDFTVYCWGSGYATHTADSNLNLGSVLTVSEIALGNSHACAILSGDTLKCWGANNFGNLGLGDHQNRASAAQMGDALPAVYLGANRTPRGITAGNNASCAVLDDGSVKCWGTNKDGRIGAGDVVEIGGNSGDMASLKPVDLGPGRRAKQVSMSDNSQCVLLDDGNVTCWGIVANPEPVVLGDELNEMGENLPTLTLKF